MGADFFTEEREGNEGEAGSVLDEQDHGIFLRAEPADDPWVSFISQMSWQATAKMP